MLTWNGFVTARLITGFKYFRLPKRCLASKNINMKKVLNVAEKNDAAKNIAGLLSNGSSRRREGYSKYNKIYELDYNVPSLGQCKMIFTSVSGHLMDCDFDLNHRKWSSCDPVSLFDAPIVYKVTNEGEDIKRTIEREVRGCSDLIIWTDCDREGESIGYEIIDVCTAINSRINVHRARFSEITSRSIKAAIERLDRPDKRLADAVNVRRELDLRIGAAFTRFQTLYLGRKVFSSRENIVISYGSCQFPTLGFVVERFKQIENFLPQKFFYINVKHKKDGMDVQFKWERVRLFDEDICNAIYVKVLQNPVAKVTNIVNKRKTKWRPTPMDTIQLEKLASSKLKLNAKTTMLIAEKLYQKGFISYPRTETNIFPSNLNLTNYVQLQTESQNWGDFAQRLLTDGIMPRQGKKTDNAHPPIYPTKFTASLTGDDARVYELVCRHFLACVSQDAVGSEVTVTIEINEEVFTVSGLTIHERNYLDVYPYDKWTNKEVPKFSMNELFVPAEIMRSEGTTTPPPLLTESDLIALMEKHGIGTDATHADHIETVKIRKYVGETPDRHFVPGKLGMGLVEGYVEMRHESDLSKPYLRADLEKDLQDICNGTKTPDSVLRRQLENYKKVFIETIRKSQLLEREVRKYTDGQRPEDFVNVRPSG